MPNDNYEGQNGIIKLSLSHMFDIVYVRVCSGPDSVVRGVGFTENWAKYSISGAHLRFMAWDVSDKLELVS